MSTALKPFYFKDLPVAGFQVASMLSIRAFLESRSNNVVSAERVSICVRRKMNPLKSKVTAHRH